MTQPAIGVLPSGPAAANVLVPGFQGPTGAAGGGLFIAATLAGLPGSPFDDQLVVVQDSTGVEGLAGLTGLPVGFVGDPSRFVQLRYVDPPGNYEFVGYGANDPDLRYRLIQESPIHTGSTPPADPSVKPFWLNSDDGRLYIRYNDGTSIQWIDIAPDITPTP
jgi:hypothetical protein